MKSRQYGSAIGGGKSHELLRQINLRDGPQKVFMPQPYKADPQAWRRFVDVQPRPLSPEPIKAMLRSINHGIGMQAFAISQVYSIHWWDLQTCA